MKPIVLLAILWVSFILGHPVFHKSIKFFVIPIECQIIISNANSTKSWRNTVRVRMRRRKRLLSLLGPNWVEGKLILCRFL